ncbi:hypothetical protein EOL73_03765 [Candidatus Saccharibacteria bacterium]|nr:hypothetical protein [Candidatus Saccharibacteria bacterium]NCU40846.1 hypothetical protein [Candidatus Saccharibacteria bacterium]
MDKSTVPVTDDAELAKVLEDMNYNMSAAAAGQSPDVTSPVAPEPPTTVPDSSTVATVVAPDQPVIDIDSIKPESFVDSTTNLNFEEATPSASPATLSPLSGPLSSDSGNLESIKKDALTELRPLIDKLSLPAEEKFDTLLLIIRSTDDRSLIPAIHEAAKSIEDDSKRAQALLDVIKEIDFFSKPAS